MAMAMVMVEGRSRQAEGRKTENEKLFEHTRIESYAYKG